MDEGENPSTGPPKWLLAEKAKKWIEEHPNYYPSDFDPFAQPEISWDQYIVQVAL